MNAGKYLYCCMSRYCYSYNCQFVIWLSVNRDKGYDGVVLESWSRWAVYGVLDDSELRNRVSHLPLSIINFLIILIKSFPRSCLAIDVSMCTCKVLLFTTSVPKCCYLVLRIWKCPCPDSQYRVMSHPLLGSNILGQS